MWIRCSGIALQVLGVWNFIVFFHFFPLKLVYFWTKSRKIIHGCFFHSFCDTDFNFGTKNKGRIKQSTLKTLIFASYWGSPLDQFSKFNYLIWLQLIFMQKPFQFCIPALKTPQPVMPYWGNTVLYLYCILFKACCFHAWNSERNLLLTVPVLYLKALSIINREFQAHKRTNFLV